MTPAAPSEPPRPLLGRDPALEPRAEREELLDGSDHDPDALADSLRQIDRVNRWLGGLRPLRAAVAEVEDGSRDPLRLLDVGTGSGMVPRDLVRSGRRRGRERSAVGVELDPQVARIAAGRDGRASGSGASARSGGAAARDGDPEADPALPVLRADGLRLPFCARTFDVVVCTLTLHHFREREAVRLLGEMARVARRRVLVSDLERSRANYLGARLLAATLWRRSPLTRHDGPLSVLRAFTPDELEALARTAGLQDVTVRRHLPFRLLLAARPPGATS